MDLSSQILLTFILTKQSNLSIFSFCCSFCSSALAISICASVLASSWQFSTSPLMTVGLRLRMGLLCQGLVSRLPPLQEISRERGFGFGFGARMLIQFEYVKLQQQTLNRRIMDGGWGMEWWGWVGNIMGFPEPYQGCCLKVELDFWLCRVYQMEKIKIKTLGEFKIIEHELGRGTMSRVLLGQWLKEPKTYIAVKEINIKQLEDSKEKQIGNEIMNMLKLQSSPYIVQLYSYARTENHLYLFLEFCEDGDLKGYIEKRNGKLSESQALIFFRHIVQGYKKLFDNNIIHRDIKPANILLKQGVAKITDFGFSRVVDKVDESAYFTYLGSPLYTAPEILKIEKFGPKCDVWSVGIVLYEMLYGRTPWNGSSLEELRKNILTTELQFKLPQRSEKVKDLLKGMLTIDPKNRISWPEIFKHPICQEQITSVKSVKASYTDIIPMFIDYLKQNVVRGYLTLNLQGVEASKSLGSDFQVDEIAKYRERMLNIFVKILHERNIAFFYNYILGLLYRFPDRLPKKVNANAELQYVVAKIGLEYIQSIIRKYLVKDPSHIPPQDWAQFKTTSEFRNINQLLSEDFNILRELFMAIKQKVKQNYIDNKGGERIAKHLDMEGDYWKQILVVVLEENLKAVTKEKNPDNVALLLREYLSKTLNPKEHFASEAFDFHSFYENNEVKYGLL